MTSCHKTLLHALSQMKAKNIPAIGIALFILLPGLLIPVNPATAGSIPGVRIYYARFDIKINNHAIKRSNLLVVPCDDEFRREKFTTLIIHGSSDASADTNAGNMETRARHNAIKLLLEQQGLKSVKAVSGTINGSNKTSTVISYEGAIKLPGRIIQTRYNNSANQYLVKMAVEFAPLSFPDRWKMQTIKFKLKQLTSNFFLMFK